METWWAAIHHLWLLHARWPQWVVAPIGATRHQRDTLYAGLLGLLYVNRSKNTFSYSAPD